MVVKVSRYVTVSVKIPQEVKERLEKMGARPSKLLKQAIEEAIRKEEVKEIKAEIKKLRSILSKISVEEVVASIREDRESR